MKLLAIGILLCSTATLVVCQDNNMGDLLDYFNTRNHPTEMKYDAAKIKKSFTCAGIYPKFISEPPKGDLFMSTDSKGEFDRGGQIICPEDVNKLKLYYDDPDYSHRYTLVMKVLGEPHNATSTVEKTVWYTMNVSGKYAGDAIVPRTKFSKDWAKGLQRFVILILDQKSQVYATDAFKKNVDKLKKFSLKEMIKHFGSPKYGLYFQVLFS